MMLHARTEIDWGDHEEPECVDVSVDLTDVTIIHPVPDGGTALYVRGAGWIWVDAGHENVVSRWKQAKAWEGLGMTTTAGEA